MKVVHLSFEHGRSPAVEALREMCFPGDYGGLGAGDRFDPRSLQVIARSGREVVGAARLTPGPDSVFEAWTGGRARIPTGERVVDLSRVCVAPSALGLSRLLVGAAMARAAELAFRYVVGTALPDDANIIRLCRDLGFEPSGGPVTEREPTGDFVVQPFVCELRPEITSRIPSFIEEQRRKASSRGVEVTL